MNHNYLLSQELYILFFITCITIQISLFSLFCMLCSIYRRCWYGIYILSLYDRFLRCLQFFGLSYHNCNIYCSASPAASLPVSLSGMGRVDRKSNFLSCQISFTYLAFSRYVMQILFLLQTGFNPRPAKGAAHFLLVYIILICSDISFKHFPSNILSFITSSMQMWLCSSSP